MQILSTQSIKASFQESDIKVGAAFKRPHLSQHPSENKKINSWLVIVKMDATHVDYVEVDSQGNNLNEGYTVHTSKTNFLNRGWKTDNLQLDESFDTSDLVTKYAKANVEASGFDALFLLPDGESFTPDQGKAGKFDPSKARRLADKAGGDPFEFGSGQFGVKLEMTLARVIKAQQADRAEEIIPTVETAAFKVLSTKVKAAFSADFVHQVTKAADKYLGISCKIAPRVGQVAQTFVYDWEELETHDRQQVETHLKAFYASCILAEQGTPVEKQDEKEVNELVTRSKTDVAHLMGGVEFQMTVFDDDAIFDVRITTNDATITLIER